jgi:hypothetical protein
MNTNRPRRCVFWLALAFGGVLVLTGLKAAYNYYLFNWKGEYESVCRTSEQAQTKGVLVCQLCFRDPNGPPVIRGQLLRITAWVEERHQDAHCLIWFPCASRLAGYNVCIGTLLDQQVRVTFPSLPAVALLSASQGQWLYYCRTEIWDGGPLVIRIGHVDEPPRNDVEYVLIPAG